MKNIFCFNIVESKRINRVIAYVNLDSVKSTMYNQFSFCSAMKQKVIRLEWQFNSPAKHNQTNNSLFHNEIDHR